MTPYYQDSWLTVYQGDCFSVLQEFEPETVHTVITSPPYWGLRDYGVSGQIGLEETPDEYVHHLVLVFREVRRVLRKDGTLWLNLGDSYASHDPGGYREGEFLNPDGRPPVKGQARNRAGNYRPSGLKPKDLVGIPWRVAFALQADGWYLRSDIIWSKPNPMPESVTDRPTKAHEYLFLLSKSPRYYYDADAVKEPSWRADTSPQSAGRGKRGEQTAYEQPSRIRPDFDGTRNLRSVWTVATQPYPGAHFATFPRKLVEPCIKAGTSEKGVCPACGTPWKPHKEQAYFDVGTRVIGWEVDCRHERTPIPATVLDPFAGSGTTGMVAQALGRRAVLIDLNGDYLVQAMERNRDIPLGLSA